MRPYKPDSSISDGPMTNLLSILCILIEALSRAHAKWGHSLNDFKFGTHFSRFQNLHAGKHGRLRVKVWGLPVKLSNLCTLQLLFQQLCGTKSQRRRSRGNQFLKPQGQGRVQIIHSLSIPIRESRPLGHVGPKLRQLRILRFLRVVV